MASDQHKDPQTPKHKSMGRWDKEFGPRKPPPEANQLGKMLADIVAGEIDDPDNGKEAAAVERGRPGKVKGGKARAAKMSPSERKSSALKAIKARWSC